MTPRAKPPAPPADGDVAFFPDWADRAEKLFERVLVHTKGRYARTPFLLEPFQRDDLIRPLFGTGIYDAQFEEWVRLYNEAWIELARKNGKSEFLAGTGIKLLVDDGEEAPEIYGAAKDKDQAALVYNVAAQMVRLSPVLSRRLKVIDSRRTIVDPRSGGFYRVIAADADGNLGQDPSGIIFDEIITQPSRDLYDAFRTSFGSGSRRSPLLIAATTAGNDPESFAQLEHDVAAGIAEDPRRAPRRFVYMRNLPRDADPWLESNWHIPNPALGTFLSLSRLRQEAHEAQEDPTKERAFRQYRLNQWQEEVADPWLALRTWDASAGMVIADDLIGRRCFAGLDLAATTDLAALALLFPPETADAEEAGEPCPVLWRYWCPESIVPILDDHTGGKFSIWAREGFITITEGDVIDYDVIHEQLANDRRDFGIIDLNLDVWNSTATINYAERIGLTAVPVPQTYRALSPPTKELTRLVKIKRISHGGNPVTRWNAAAMQTRADPNENIRPVRPARHKTGKRIDGIVALILAIDGWQRRGQIRRSAYEERGLDVV